MIIELLVHDRTPANKYRYITNLFTSVQRTDEHTAGTEQK